MRTPHCAVWGHLWWDPPRLSLIFYHSSPYPPSLSHTGHPGGPQTHHTYFPSAPRMPLPESSPLALWRTGFILAFKSQLKFHPVLRAAFSKHQTPLLSAPWPYFRAARSNVMVYLFLWIPSFSLLECKLHEGGGLVQLIYLCTPGTRYTRDI